MSEYHTPVLLDESVSALINSHSGIYADATFGGGGHTSEILRRLSPEGRVVSFDRDSDAILNRPDDDRLTLIRSDFRWIHNHLLNEGYTEGIDGILADLGVSSHQFDTAERGFSFRYEAPLDMRMNQEASLTAADILNTYEQEDIDRILRLYGEVDGSRRIAQMICKARENSPIATTTDLGKAIESALPKFAEHKFLASLPGSQDRGQSGNEIPGKISVRGIEGTKARRKTGHNHLPLPGRQDGKELHQGGKHRGQGRKGLLRQFESTAQGSEQETDPSSGDRNSIKHKSQKRKAQDCSKGKPIK